MGDTYNRLTIVGVEASSMWKNNGKLETPNEWKYWCQCKCGNVCSPTKIRIITGKTKSCGCLQREKAKLSCIAKRKINPIEVEGDITKIFFFNAPGEYTIIDTEDYSKVKDFCWHKRIDDSRVYAFSDTRDSFESRLNGLHILICPCSEGYIPDHKNGDGLDNRKANLRPLTNSQNQMNKELRKDNTSGYPGVTFIKKKKLWVARISLGGERLFLGSSKNKEDVIKLRKEAEENYFGEYSYDNSRKEEEK